MNRLANNQYKQHGATLVVSLVMLVVLTLLVISSIRSSNINLRIAGNMQYQAEAIAAAQQATEAKISSDFWTIPAASNVSVTIGPTTYTAAVSAPVCSGSRPLFNSEPNLPPECLSSGTATNTWNMSASAPTANITSWCNSQQWEIQTSVSDSTTGARTTIHQGVSLNVPIGPEC